MVGAVLSTTNVLLFVPETEVLVSAFPARSSMVGDAAQLRVTVAFRLARSPPETVTL